MVDRPIVVQRVGGSQVGAQGRFVGVGIDHYVDFDDLTYPVSEVRAVSECLASDFSGELVCDAGEYAVRDVLKAVARSRPEMVVLLWSGHGSLEGGRFTLYTADEGGRIAAADVISFCAESGASQLLFVVDACHAGAGVLDATAVASAWLAEYPPQAERVWFGVLVSCSGAEQARDGAFGAVLQRLLKEGPRSADMRRRWSVHNRLIPGEDLGQAVLEDWEDPGQQPDFLRRGRGWFMIPNPLWDPGAPEQVVEHLLLAARGGDAADERSWFTGRVGEVDEVVAWVRSVVPGIRLVIGAAGTGKSAIVGRVVSASNPTERGRLGNPETWGHADPGERSVHAHAHARGVTADRLAGVLDEQLIRAGILPATEHGRRNAAELVGALQRYRQGPGAAKPVTPVVVIDGLDEARGEAFAIAEDLLCRLAGFATVIVSTRPLIRADVPRGLLEVLAPVEVLDLDAAEQLWSQQRSIELYVRRRLTGVSATMDAAAVATVLADSHHTDTPFLLARIISDQLRSSPIDTTIDGWAEHLTVSLGQAFETDLQHVGAPGIPVNRSHTTLEVARALLIALTWGLGAGLPEPEWLVVTQALTNTDIGHEHVSWVLDELGRYVVQDGEAGVAVYRLAHQSLADHLRPAFRPNNAMVFDPAAEPVALALLARYRTLLQDGHPAHAPTYLWLYAFRHAAVAGPSAIAQLRALTELDSTLHSDLAVANLSFAEAVATRGFHGDAVAPTEEAVRTYRELVADNPIYLPDLAGALNNLSSSYSGVGRRGDAVSPVEEAVRTYRELVAENAAYLPALASALNNLGNRYSEVGRRGDAVAPAEEAIHLWRELVAENAAYLPALAGALNNLGNRYSGVGRRGDAVAPTEEAIHLWRELVAENAAYLPNLANALNNLGNLYSEVGRRGDAVAPTEEAVRTYRELAAENAAYLPDLAGTLSNLGSRYSEVGRRGEAVAPSTEAVRTIRELAAENAAYLPDLAGALNNLGNRYSGVGRRGDAVAPIEEAIHLWRELVAENAAYLPDLAGALNNLGGSYSEVGRRGDAVAPAEEAIHLLRELVAENAAYLPDLASALNNLGNLYSEVGRRGEAVALIEEAVRTFRELAAENAAYLPDLAGALNNLGNRYSGVGRRGDAVAPAEEAIHLWRELVAENAAYLPDLAGTLSNLGASYSGVGRGFDAVSPVEEAVRTYRELAAENPAYLPDLAMALNNLGNLYSEVGRRGDAVAPTEEAVRTYRELAAENAAYLPDLAGTLNNLGNRYSEVGRRGEAVAPSTEAVRTYRELAAENPAYLPDLAGTLNNLQNILIDRGRTSDIEPAWQAALELQSRSGRRYLLLARAQMAPIGDLRTVQWLAPLTAHLDDRTVAGAARAVARHHRANDPTAWDAVWAEYTGTGIPAWLTIDPEVMTSVMAWIDTSTYTDQRDYLVSHPELLDSSTDIAVDEVLLALTDEAATWYRSIRESARRRGVDTAYEPLMRRIALNEFIDAEPSRQRQLLQDSASMLRGEQAWDELTALIDTHPETALRRAAGLIAIASNEHNPLLLGRTFDAIEAPFLFAELLADVTRDPEPLSLLQPLVAVAATAAQTDEELGLVLLYAACAAAISGDADATTYLEQARSRAPQQQRSWITLLASLGAVHPAVLGLIPLLIAEGSDDVTD